MNKSSLKTPPKRATIVVVLEEGHSDWASDLMGAIKLLQHVSDVRRGGGETTVAIPSPDVLPLQPVICDSNGTHRFRANALVQYLYDWAQPRGCGMNELHMLPGIPVEDWEQFAALTGYSISGFSELSYVRNSTYEAAARASERLSEDTPQS